MADTRSAPRPERLLSVIELQNAIAGAGMNSDEVMGIVVERAATLTSATSALIALAEGDEVVVRAVARPTTAAMHQRLAIATTVAGRCVTDRRPIQIADAATDPRIDEPTRVRTGAGSLACVPLLYGEAAVGVIEVASARTGAFSDEDVETLRLLAQIVAIALHRAYTYPRPRQDSLHDALTGLGNRRAYEERIEAELARNLRYSHSFSLARLELAGLENAGDRFGQAAADDALRELATILKRDTRAIDACFRIAADEFAIVMTGTSLEGARILVDRCRAHIVEARLCDGTVEAAFGVVEAGQESPDELAARAAAAVI